MLHVTALDDGEPLKNIIAIHVFPDEGDLQGSTFVQFYFHYQEFTIGTEFYPTICNSIMALNKLLALGHYNVSPDLSALYYKYIWTIPKEEEINKDILIDVMDMIIYAMNSGLEAFNKIIK